FRVTPLQQLMTATIRPALLLLLAAVAFVLLIACANVANLLLVRAAARQKEMAVRAALGAKRLRLIRQVMAESLLLSMFGGVLGTLAGVVAVRALAHTFSAILPRLQQIVDARLLLFGVAVTLVTALLFGAAPAWQLADAGLLAHLAG